MAMPTTDDIDQSAQNYTFHSSVTSVRFFKCDWLATVVLQNTILPYAYLYTATVLAIRLLKISHHTWPWCCCFQDSYSNISCSLMSNQGYHISSNTGRPRPRIVAAATRGSRTRMRMILTTVTEQALQLFVLYNSFPWLTTELKGCVYYCQHLTVVAV